MGIIGGDSEAILEVLHSITPEHIAEVKAFAENCVEVSLEDTPQETVHRSDSGNAGTFRIRDHRRQPPI